MSRADGFAILHGASNSSSKVLLTQQSDDSFQAGSHDTWSTRDMQDLGPLQKLTIGLKEQVTAQRLFYFADLVHKIKTQKKLPGISALT